jgi:predicted ester cyclase
MIALLERLVPLWTDPVDGRGDPEAAFGEVYADPVVVNGTEMSLTALVARARSLQQAFDQLGMDILDTVETPDRVVVAFEMRGRHVGPYASPLGTVGSTGRDIAVRTVDVLTVVDGLVTAIWVVADDLALLRQLDAARLNGLCGTRQRRGPPHRLSDAVLPPDCDVWHDLRVPDTLTRRRAGLALIHIRHGNLEFLQTAGSSAHSAR